MNNLELCEPDVMFFVDPATDRVLFHNSGAVELYEYDSKDFEGLEFKHITGTLAKEISMSGKKYLCRQYHRKKSGAEFEVQVSVSRVELGEQELLCALVWDVEKREEMLKQETLMLKSAVINRYGLDEIVGQSLKMQEVYSLILEVASSDAGILIYGESGTGKELTARAIHDLGSKKNKPFLPVNCGGIPETLIESEFFGYRKGAFTGAHIDKSGYLEIADGGTLFLDEIGEINLNMQVKLLRAIDGNGFTPLGSNQVIRPSIRIIAATNKDLESLVSKGLMRSDFFYRINVVPIYIPPLRERRDDISLLILHFLKIFSAGKSVPHIPASIMKALEEYDWPGNVRELQNIINRYVTLNRIDVFESFLGSGVDTLLADEMKAGMNVSEGSLQDVMRNYEKKIIVHQLKQTRWNQSKAAKNLGVNRKTLYTKIKKLGILNV